MNPLGFTVPMTESSPTNPQDPAALDAAVAARLERLAARRTPPTTSSARPTPTPAYASAATGPTKRKRRHAAKGARQAALALSLATTGGLSYAMSLSPTANAATAAQPAGIVSVPASGAMGATSGSTNVTTNRAPVADTTPIVVNGDAYSNRFGTVQVQATFSSDGTITAVSALQTPDGDRTSVSINNRAVPTLNSEALTVQNANVDTVSGATYTSHDYQRSLQSAIDTARASGLIAAA